MSDLDDLRAVAEAATPGPWEFEAEGESHCGEPGCCSDYWDNRIWSKREHYILFESHILGAKDAEYIATFDPPTVLGLLDRIAELETAALTKAAQSALDRVDAINAVWPHVEREIRPLYDRVEAAEAKRDELARLLAAETARVAELEATIERVRAIVDRVRATGQRWEEPIAVTLAANIDKVLDGDA